MLFDWFRDAAHAVHMPAEMAESKHDQFRERAAEASARYWQQAEQERQEIKAVLNREWGRNFDVQIENVQQAVNRLGGDIWNQVFNETALGDHPALVYAPSSIWAMCCKGTAVPRQKRLPRPHLYPQTTHHPSTGLDPAPALRR
tara:strand:+ start:1042 stop:1473 length:432 start_codon:yes stop_codon:yes gene_type:complete